MTNTENPNTNFEDSPADGTPAAVPGETTNIATLVVVLVLLVAGAAALAYRLSKSSYDRQYIAAIFAYDEATRLSTPDAWSRAISDAGNASACLYVRLAGRKEAADLVKKAQAASDACMAFRTMHAKLTNAYNEARQLDTFDAWDKAYALALQLLQTPYTQIGDIGNVRTIAANIAKHFNANCVSILDQADFELQRTANDAPPAPIPSYYGDAKILASIVLDNINAKQHHARARDIINRIATALELRTQYGNLLEVAERTYIEAVRQNSSELWVKLMSDAREALAAGFSRFGNTARATMLALEGEESLFNLSQSWLKVARTFSDTASRQEAYGHAADVLKLFATLHVKESVKSQARNMDGALLEERRMFGEYTKLLSVASEMATATEKKNGGAGEWNAVALAAKKAVECAYSASGSVEEAVNIYARARGMVVDIYNTKLQGIRDAIEALPANGLKRLMVLEDLLAQARALAAGIPAEYADFTTFRPDDQIGAITTMLAAGVAFGSHKNQVRALAVSPDMKLTATSCVDLACDIYIWDSETGAAVATLDAHRDFVTCLIFSPDGKHLISGGWDKKIIVWNTANWTQVTQLDGHDDKVVSVACSNDGAYLAAGLWTGGCAVWHIATRQMLFINRNHSDSILDLCFSPDDSLLVTAGADRDIAIFDMVLGKMVGVIHGHTNSVYGVAFSPDGMALTAAGSDGILSIWGNPGFLLNMFVQTEHVFHALRYVGNSLLATISDDETVMLYNADTLAELASVKGASHFGRIIVSKSGRYLFIPGVGGKVIVHSVSFLIESKRP